VIVLSSKKLFFVEIDSLKVFHTETLTNDEVWQYYFIGTNKFMTEKVVDGKKTYTSYSFDIKSDPRVCSKTCNGQCDGKNFYQCPLFPHIFYTMIWGSIIILLLAILVWAFLVSKKNYQQSQEKDEKSKAEKLIAQTSPSDDVQFAKEGRRSSFMDQEDIAEVANHNQETVDQNSDVNLS